VWHQITSGFGQPFESPAPAARTVSFNLREALPRFFVALVHRGDQRPVVDLHSDAVHEEAALDLAINYTQLLHSAIRTSSFAWIQTLQMELGSVVS